MRFKRSFLRELEEAAGKAGPEFYEALGWTRQRYHVARTRCFNEAERLSRASYKTLYDVAGIPADEFLFLLIGARRED